MWKSVAGFVCAFSSVALVALADEPKPPTAEEVDKELSIAEAYLMGDRPVKLGTQPIPANLIRNIGRLPQDSPVRLRAIALARRYAAIPEYVFDWKKRPERVDDRQAHFRLGFAWGVLRETGVLRDGMRLEEVVALVGQPTAIRPETAEWYYSSTMHVNPILAYLRSDGPAEGQKAGRVVVGRR
jgi:hypothetical protein